uniref:Secreted protein n=1 Tax=Aegilops tauschii subsp. strangulata TaxID=200361 RepID=A0A453R714_AEGTS
MMCINNWFIVARSLFLVSNFLGETSVIFGLHMRCAIRPPGPLDVSRLQSLTVLCKTPCFYLCFACDHTLVWFCINHQCEHYIS